MQFCSAKFSNHDSLHTFAFRKFAKVFLGAFLLTILKTSSAVAGTIEFFPTANGDPTFLGQSAHLEEFRANGTDGDWKRIILDFVHPQTDVKFIYNDGGTPGNGATSDDTFSITGQVFGTAYNIRFDAASNRWATFEESGLYDYNFAYTEHIGQVTDPNTGKFDIVVTNASPNNKGTLVPLFGFDRNDTVFFTDKFFDKEGFSFRFEEQGPRNIFAFGWFMYSDPNNNLANGAFGGDIHLFAGVPEPGTWALLGTGLLFGALARRRRRLEEEEVV